MSNGIGIGQGFGPGQTKDWDEYLPELDEARAHFATDKGDSPGFALGEDERLPWLESAEDVQHGDPRHENAKLIGMGLAALLLLAAIVGAIYWLSHRQSIPPEADGSLIAASREPYKIAPKDPGGKTFQGTGDASFKVSEGERPAAALAAGSVGAAGRPAAPAPSASVAAGPASAAPAMATGGVGAQIGAFRSAEAAEAAWTKLVAGHEALKGLSHRVQEGKADIGTVYRLQAVTGDAAAASALCAKLQAGGLQCQVKR